MADEEIFGLPETLPPYRLRTELPTIVRELCPKAVHIAVWLAIRWLLAGERTRALSLREIAARAKVNFKTVGKVIDDLLRLRLIEIIAYEDVPNKNLTGAPHGSPLIRIPKWIEEENAHYTARFLVRVEPPVADRIPDEQMSLDLHTSQDVAPVPKTVQGVCTENGTGSVPKMEQDGGSPVPKMEQSLYQKRYRNPVPKTEQEAPLKLKEKNLKEERKVNEAHSYRTPDGEPPLADHPFDLWQRINPQASSDDTAKIARLAADHDAPYRAYGGGYGMYWVGRALQAANRALDPGKPITLNYVRNILASWRSRTTDDVAAYGSDSPAYQRKQAQQQRRAQQLGTTEPPAEPLVVPPNLAALWQRVQDRLRPQLEQREYNTWIEETQLLDLDEHIAVVGCSNIFARERLQDRYVAQIEATLATELGQPRTVEIVIASTLGSGD